jgi:hypothetical protein
VITTADALTEGATLRSDVAVVGAGPAGIVTALELAAKGFDVLLIESGHEKFDQSAQELSEAGDLDPHVHSPMSLTVRRQLGGTSVIWGGRCVPLDRVDFEQRSFLSGSSWPVSYDELLPYFQRACDWLRCGRAVFDISGLGHLPSSIVPGLRDGDMRASTFERWSLPTNFGREYGRTLRASKRVNVITGLTCTEIVCPPGESRVHHLECRAIIGAISGGISGKGVRVQSRAYVIAGGGLETTRLLLASPGPHGKPLGDHSGHLGSWYMGHVEGVVANIRFLTPARATVFGYERDIDGTYVRRRMTVSPEIQLKEELPNAAAWLANPELADPRHKSGILSFVYLALTSPAGRRLAPDAQRLSLSGEDVPGSPYGGAEKGPATAHLKNITRDWASVLRFAVGFGAKRFLVRGRRAPGFFVYSKDNVYPLQYHAEQTPNRKSRVTLTSARDALGRPKLSIDLRFSQQDVDGVVRSHRVWDEYLRQTGLGRLEYLSEDPESVVWSRIGGGFHQVGTTRMAARAEDGVVNEDLAVFGVSNLFVASSSVFVTAGQANPTFMILVLALRMADHLQSVLNGR